MQMGLQCITFGNWQFSVNPVFLGFKPGGFVTLVCPFLLSITLSVGVPHVAVHSRTLALFPFFG